MRTVIITIAHGRHDHLRRQLIMVDASSRPAHGHVVVTMADPALAAELRSRSEVTVVELDTDPAALPLAAARNAGAVAALALGADLLIFLDVDCLPDADLVRHYQAAVQPSARPSSGGSLLCGPVAYLPPPPEGGYDLDRLAEHRPHPARPVPEPGRLQPDGDPRLFWSLSFAVTADTWHRVGGFDERYVGYGAEDTDFAMAAAQAGVPLTWVGGATAYHQWHPTNTPPTQHLDDILRNGELFADRWGWWPMEGWLRAFAEQGLISWDGEQPVVAR